MRRIDLSKLRAFYMVAREGSMNRAAVKMNVSQPSLSLLVGDLEHNVRAKLFERTSKGVHLTPQGERLFIHAKKLLEEHEAFEKVFFEQDDEIEGELKIVTTPYLGSEWLMFKIKNFLKTYPKIKINIILREDKDIYIEEGDIAICTPIHHQPHLIQHYLFTTCLRMVASPDYLKKYGVPQTPEDLDSHPIITYGGNSYNPYGSANWILNLGRTKYAASRESYLQINSLQGIINAALSGYGIAEVPDFPGVLRPELIEIKLNDTMPQFDVNYVFHEKRKNSKILNLLLKYLQK
ncbi:MAG: LysR family transcriptional regulator [Candidatus Paracaedibacteraceae bacterium]|nr:LysR family transcriptional regulator [Candidatus Paracaedibacteraceae bacterium]